MRPFLLLIVIPAVVFGQPCYEEIIGCPRPPKNGHWIYYGKDRPEWGYPPEAKIEEGKYVDDRKEGTWIKYHNDGVTPKLIGEYKNNRPAGKYQKFHPNGVLKEVGNFEKNQYHDSIKRYYENGQLEYCAYFDSIGKEHGLVQYWFPDGTLELAYEANHGTPSYRSRQRPVYNGCDDPKAPLQYAQDTVQSVRFPQPPQKETIDKTPAPKPRNPPNTHGVKWQTESYNKVYNDDDEIWQDGLFKNGLLWDGKLYVYDGDGILLKVKVYKSGIYHSNGQL